MNKRTAEFVGVKIYQDGTETWWVNFHPPLQPGETELVEVREGKVVKFNA